MTDGKNEAEHIQELPKQWPTSGETLAYSKGMEAGEKADMSNPQFYRYCERIAYRAGWIAGMKQRQEIKK